MRGRIPKPTALRAIGPRSHHKQNRTEPKPAGGTTAPSWLSKAAAAEWARVYGEMARIGLVTKLDRVALAAYCTAYARLKAAEADIEERGPIILQGTVNEKANPSVNIADQAMQRIRQLCQEFGLTPSSRSRIQLPGEEDAGDEFDNIVSRRSKRA